MITKTMLDGKNVWSTWVKLDDIREMVEWQPLDKLPKEDNILVAVKTKHTIVDDYEGVSIANYAFGYFDMHNRYLIPVEWKLLFEYCKK